MTNPIINPQPNYSGVTIQISNPAVNVGEANGKQAFVNRNGNYPQNDYGNYNIAQNGYNVPTSPQIAQYPNAPYTNYGMTQPIQQGQVPQYIGGYPPQYYLNNYNYQYNTPSDAQCRAAQAPAQGYALGDPNIPQLGLGQQGNIPNNSMTAPDSINQAKPIFDKQKVEYSIPEEQVKELEPLPVPEPKLEGPQDFSKSKNIIDNLNAREDVLKAEEKNSKQKRVVALTDEYIKSLENYLNNPNQEIRLMASKEILTRLDEDKDRYDDAALNALLNKMLQDPSKLIRIAALSAFNSQLASGNDFTLTLLKNIQNNPSADKEDVLQAADILLKMSAGTEVKNIPNPAAKETPKQEK